MFEKVTPSHPDKVADRIAGAIVDVAYSIQDNPKIAVEVLLGHRHCYIISETSVSIDFQTIEDIVLRIAGELIVEYVEVPQDVHLSDNQIDGIKCGDNGIFKGVPVTEDEVFLVELAGKIYSRYYSDGKYIYSSRENKLIICQSNSDYDIVDLVQVGPETTLIVNPLGYWTGGLGVDTGATNRKLGSDMGLSVTGGGLHGKDLSKADVSINIYAWLKAQESKNLVEIFCAIGDQYVDNLSYTEVVKIAKKYIQDIGGFEKFAEWGLIRPIGCESSLVDGVS